MYIEISDERKYFNKLSFVFHAMELATPRHNKCSPRD